MLCSGMTDADMSNCHPRILLWICDSNGIAAETLRAFVADHLADDVYGGRCNARDRLATSARTPDPARCAHATHPSASQITQYETPQLTQ